MASEIKVDTIVNAGGDNDTGIDLSTNDNIKFDIAGSEKAIIDSSGNVGIGTSSPTITNGRGLVIADATAARLKLCDTTTGEGASDGFQVGHSGGLAFIFNHENEPIQFGTNNAERMRVDSNGHLLVAKTSTGIGTVGAELKSTGELLATVSGDACAFLNRTSNDGALIDLRRDGTARGFIGLNNGDPFIARSSGNGMRWFSGGLHPCDDSGATADDAVDLGNSSGRFDDIFATNGTVQTSDQNEKNTIADSDLGLDFVNRLAPKSYIFKGKTRTHYGLIAQDVETVLSDINKETSEFAGFIKEDISENQDGSQYRYGLRYTEFVGILIKALQEADDKIDALTARVTALESK